MRQPIHPSMTSVCRSGRGHLLRATCWLFAPSLRALTFIALLVGTVLASLLAAAPGDLRTAPREKDLGDRLQIALPLAGFGCAIATGRAPEYAARFAAMLIAAHSIKAALGSLPLNQRPNGNLAGFPSAHSAAASFGATALALDCLAQSPIAQAAALLTAGYVGTSRITASAHTGVQVLCGWAFGAAFAALTRPQRRRPSRKLRRLRILLRRHALHRLALYRALRYPALRYPALRRKAQPKDPRPHSNAQPTARSVA